MPHGLLLSDLAALVQVVLIDLTLAGDNAVVVGLAVTGLPVPQRRLAILIGVGGAAVLRIGFGAVTLQLLQIVGLLLAGGILLLWVCWKMYRELRRAAHSDRAAAPHSLRDAIVQIVLADVSMSLDNVLAVAGAAEGHFWVLAAGLILSVALMGLAANLVARLLERYRWIAWIGLVIVLTVALRLIWAGGWEIAHKIGRSG
jgi:YjbE family integral membrane protein